MATEQITIKTSSGRDIVFEGELVAQAKGSCDQPVTQDRWYDISVNRRTDDMWVVCIEFHTSSPHEKPHVELEVVDRPDEVETVLMLYEPLKHLNRRRIRPRYETDRHKFYKALRSAYNALMDQILADMQPLVDEYRERAPEEVAEPESGGRWRGFLSMLGLR